MVVVTGCFGYYQEFKSTNIIASFKNLVPQVGPQTPATGIFPGSSHQAQLAPHPLPPALPTGPHLSPLSPPHLPTARGNFHPCSLAPSTLVLWSHSKQLSSETGTSFRSMQISWWWATWWR